jgi:copper transport protein
LVLLCIVAHLALPASPVGAHAFLKSSDPAANAVLPSAPRSVTLTFTEPLESSYSRAELFDATGTQIPGATSSIGPEPRSMIVQIPPGLSNGTYSLLWRTLSTADGHTAQGYVPFTVGTEADVRTATPPSVADNSSALPESVLAAAGWHCSVWRRWLPSGRSGSSWSVQRSPQRGNWDRN